MAAHSDFRHRPLDRLNGTLAYMLGIVYGDRAEMQHVADVVRSIHRGVTGPGYSANDPNLQVWVAATLYESTTLLYEHIFGPFPDEQRTVLLREYGTLATALGCPVSRWPADAAAFRAYWDGMIDTLEVSDAARTIAHDLLYSSNIPLLLRPMLPAQRLASIGLLPSRIRSGFGLAWTPARQRVLDVSLGFLRRTYPYVPRPVRHVGVTLYLRDLHRRRRPESS